MPHTLSVEKLTAASWITQWQFSWFGMGLCLVLAVLYLVGWARARGRDGAPSAWRLVMYLVVGVGSLAYALCGPIAVYAPTFLWIFAFQVAVVTAVTPIGIALGRPLDVACVALGSERPRRMLAGRLGRAVMYPLVSSILATVSLIAVFFTGYGQAALESSSTFAVLVLHLLFVGLLVVLPLLADDLLPEWATPGVRALLACVDGLFDAIPGILLMTHSGLLMPHFPGLAPSHAAARDGLSASLDQRFAGGALLAVAESIGIPLLVAVFVDWMRADRATAAHEDARLDAEFGHGPSESTPWWLEEQRRR